MSCSHHAAAAAAAAVRRYLVLLLGRYEVVNGLAFFQSLLHLNEFLNSINQQLHELTLHTHTGTQDTAGVPQLADSRARRSTTLLYFRFVPWSGCGAMLRSVRPCVCLSVTRL